MAIENLFEQTKDLHIIGERLSGEPEIVHEIEDKFRRSNHFYPVIRNQIEAILRLVPSVFPEDWQSPERYDGMTPKQQRAYIEIAKKGVCACPGPIIQRTIELALEYREKYLDKTSIRNV